MEKYFAVDDRNRRLGRTICMYGNSPVYVQCSDPLGQTINSEEEVFVCALADCKRGPYHKIKYTDDAFHARAFPLGYMTHCNGATYLCRTPAQQQRQGLHADIVDSTGGDSLPSNWFLSSWMHNCIVGKHLSFAEAVDQTNKTGRSHSFDRLWAVSPHHKTVLSLQFRGRAAGFITGHTITLFNSREDRLLRSLLQEKGLKVNDCNTDNKGNTRAALPH